MAWEADNGNVVSLNASTGLRQYRFVTMKDGGNVGYPTGSTVGQPVIGVIVSEGTTGSTRDPQAVAVAYAGVVKVEAEASTLTAGAWVSASTVGRAQPATNAGDARVGIVVGGSSVAANHVLSVLLVPYGSTSVAP